MREQTRPAYFLMPPLPPERAPAPRRDDGLRGFLRLTISCRTPVHIGSGSPWLLSPRLVGGVAAVRTEGGLVPIIPGSSLKGAVRAVVEAVTPSCERVALAGHGADACRGADVLCPACRVFGAPGWRATVGFGDLAPADGVRPEVGSVAQRYSFRNAPRRGRRLYRVSPEEPLPQSEEELVLVASGSRFRGALYLDGVERVGLGLILIALGVGPHGLPFLRLGGGKNRGLGVVDVDVTAGRLYGSLRQWLRDDRLLTTPEQVASFLERAQEEALETYPQMRARLDRIRREYEGSQDGGRR